MATSPWGRVGFAVVFSLSFLSTLAHGQGDALVNGELLHPQPLVEAVLQHHPALPAAQAAWRVAQSQVLPAGALDDPMLSANAAPKSFGQTQMERGVGIALSQRLPWPGKRGLKEKIAEFEARAVAQSVVQTRLDLIQLAKEAFADWYFVHAGLKVNQASRKLWADIRDIAELNYASGRGSQQDVLQADIEYEMLGHRQVVLERQRREALAQLNRLLNRDGGAPLPPPAPLGSLTSPPPLAVLRAQALAHRTELGAAQAELKADSARVELAQRQFYPDFEISTGYSSMWSDDDMRWSVGIGVNIPLGHAKRHAAVAGARAAEMESRWRLQDLSLEILKEVEQIHACIAESRHLLALHEERLLPLARANLEAARTAYRARTGELESLLRAERSLFETELNYQTARADYYRNMAALERAVGGWDHPVAKVAH